MEYDPSTSRLRALLARVHGDTAAYADFRDRYRELANSLVLRRPYRGDRRDAVIAPAPVVGRWQRHTKVGQASAPTASDERHGARTNLATTRPLGLSSSDCGPVGLTERCVSYAEEIVEPVNSHPGYASADVAELRKRRSADVEAKQTLLEEICAPCCPTGGLEPGRHPFRTAAHRHRFPNFRAQPRR
jgi:hypothetical protein